jgi:hypothetical protein
LIIEHLVEIERDLAWLGRKTEIPYGTLYSCLVQKHFEISKENVKKVNKILETNFIK